jgi:hypothetical protein
VYYKLNPHIQKAINQVGLSGKMPTREAFDQLTGSVYGEVMRMHPEFAEYAYPYEQKQTGLYAPMQYSQGPGYYGNWGRGYYGRGGGLFRDLIGILLLQELFGRRGGCCW